MTAPTLPAMDARLGTLFAALERDATGFDFYNVLRLIDARNPGAAPLGRAAHPRDEPLRLTQQPSLAFAPAALHSYQAGAAAYGLGRLAVYHFGLFGPHGALPTHLTEYAQERLLHAKDETLLRFCDIFQHRMILLFYRAWADCQAVTSLDCPERDAFSRHVGSLIGLGQSSVRRRDSVPDHAKLHHSGHLARPQRNPAGLCRALGDWLRAPVQLQEYQHQWLVLGPGDRTRLTGTVQAGGLGLGPATSCLGQGAVLGERVPDVQHRFRLRIGPLPLAEFERHLPGRSRFFEVRDWVRNYLGLELAWDLRLVLRQADVQPTCLGRRGQLGWTTWIGPPEGGHPHDADDVLLDPERLSASPLAAPPPPAKEDCRV